MDPSPKAQLQHFKELRILVLYNGDFIHQTDHDDFTSREDVEIVAQELSKTLAARGHFVEVKSVDHEDIPLLSQRFSKDPPDVVFNLCESLHGKDRNEIVLPALLDLWSVPYTGSSAVALGLCLNKVLTQRMLMGASIPVPKFWVVNKPIESLHTLRMKLEEQGLAYPLIVKPSETNASVGIDRFSVVHDDEQLFAQMKKKQEKHDEPLIVEKYIDGKELNVSILGNEEPVILPVHEMDFSSMPKGYPKIVSYEGKWDKRSEEYAGSAPVPATGFSRETLEKVSKIARLVHQTLGLSGYARCDIRIDSDGQPYVIDVNPNCDLGKDAGFVKAVFQAQMSYEDLLEQIIFFALSRRKHDIVYTNQLDHRTTLSHSFWQGKRSNADQANPVEKFIVYTSGD